MILRLLLAAVILLSLVSCEKYNKYHLKIENQMIKKAILKFINDYSQTRERFIVQLFFVSNTCKGTEIMVSADLPVLSTVFNCPADGFDTINNHLVLIYGGTGILGSQDYEMYINDVFTFFPIQDLENDWDLKANEPLKTYVYNPKIQGIRITNDSLTYFSPENGWYFYPCIYCN